MVGYAILLAFSRTFLHRDITEDGVLMEVIVERKHVGLVLLLGIPICCKRDFLLLLFDHSYWQE